MATKSKNPGTSLTGHVIAGIVATTATIVILLSIQVLAGYYTTSPLIVSAAESVV